MGRLSSSVFAVRMAEWCRTEDLSFSCIFEIFEILASPILTLAHYRSLRRCDTTFVNSECDASGACLSHR